jgi:hypothetical protein
MLLFLVPLIFAVTAIGLVTLAFRDRHASEYLNGYPRGVPASAEPFALRARALAVMRSVASQVRGRPGSRPALRPIGGIVPALDTLARPRRARLAPSTWLIRAWPVAAVFGALAIAVSVGVLAQAGISGVLPDGAEDASANSPASAIGPRGDAGEVAPSEGAAGPPPTTIAAAGANAPVRTPSPTPTPVSPGRATLEIRAQQDAEVRITVDGAVAYTGMLRANETRSWDGQQRVQVWTNNGQNLLVTVNGHSLGALSSAVGHPDWNHVDWGWAAGWSP